MKRLLIAILMVSMVQGVFAQKIEIKGTVRNATDNEATEFVNVVLQTTDSVFVNGVSTNNHGSFIFNKVEAGNYRLVLSSVGYNTQYITLNGVKRNTDLGDILLEDASVALEGVTINGSSQISRPDRKLVFPSERQMKVSTNGVNLLQELMLPRIQVNPMNNEIGISGGGELQIRINGAKADINEIKALRPADIIRIEYHDNPGLRYGNAEIVLDYIVRRPDTGGSFGTDLSQGVNAMWGNYNVFGKVNHKKSEFGLSYYMGPRDFYGMYRDNEETFRLADGNTIQRVEKGEPSHAMLFMQNLNVSYSLQASKNSLFSATFRLRGNNQPNWDYQGVLYNVNDETDMVNMIDRTKNSWTRPSLDLYYQQNLKNKQTLVFNLVGTYNREKSHRIYQESLHNEILTDINNNVLGDKYSLIAEAIYEKQFSKGNALSFGLQHTQSYSNNEYRNGHNYDTRMNQGNSYIFSEYRGKIHKLDYRLGVSLTRFYYNQSGNDKPSEKYNVNPKATLHYTFSENSYLRWKAEVFNTTPSLSDLSAIEQTVDSFQIRRGNPNLKSYMCYRTELTYEWKKGIFYSNLWGAYDYRPNAIMDAINLQLNDKSAYSEQGQIESISGVIDRSTGTVSLRAVFPNKEGLLHSGGAGNVIVPVQKTGALTIPQVATFEIQDKRYVYKVVDGKAQSNPVQVTRVNGGREFIVDEGLVPGDVIVAEGVGLLREGTPVKAKAAQTPVAGVTKANQSSSAETINQSSSAEAINQSSLAETTAQSLSAETATTSPATTTEN